MPQDCNHWFNLLVQRIDIGKVLIGGSPAFRAGHLQHLRLLFSLLPFVLY
jgi:hypothetical protein